MTARDNTPRTYEYSRSVFPSIDTKEVLTQIRKQGLYSGFNLPSQPLAEILAFTQTTRMHGGFGDVTQAKTHFFPQERAEMAAKTGSNFIIGHYAEAALRCPAIRQIENDPKILSIAHSYFGKPPGSVKTMLWWSFATQASTQERLGSSQTVLFHFDEFDYRFLYFSFYLTDVDEMAGAHICVKGSHNKKSLRLLFSTASQSDETILGQYGSENIVTLTGKAGFGFVEDAFAYHKATAPVKRDRLFLQVRVGSSHRGN